MDLGDFTPDQQDATDPEIPDTFHCFGEEWEVPGTVGAGSLLRFTWRMRSATDQQDRGAAAAKRALSEGDRLGARRLSAAGELEANAAIYDMLLASLGEDQITRFLQVADRHGTKIFGLIEVCHQIMGAITDRPTRQLSGSSDGLLTTTPDSTANGSGDTDSPAHRADPPEPVVLTPNQQQRAAFAEMTGDAETVAASYS